MFYVLQTLRSTGQVEIPSAFQQIHKSLCYSFHEAWSIVTPDNEGSLYQGMTSYSKTLATSQAFSVHVGKSSTQSK